MEWCATRLPEVLLITPRVFQDARGYFFENFQAKRYADLPGLDVHFVQDNVSRSSRGTLRGLHYQRQCPQGKLVTVLSGTVFDVAVDVRPKSPTFGEWVGVILSDTNHSQFYIPPGFAHGFLVMSDEAIFHYKCTDYYNAADEGGIIWNDSTLKIDWPLEGEPLLSQKDQQYAELSAIPVAELPKLSLMEVIV